MRFSVLFLFCVVQPTSKVLGEVGVLAVQHLVSGTGGDQRHFQSINYTHGREKLHDEECVEPGRDGGFGRRIAIMNHSWPLFFATQLWEHGLRVKFGKFVLASSAELSHAAQYMVIDDDGKNYGLEFEVHLTSCLLLRVSMLECRSRLCVEKIDESRVDSSNIFHKHFFFHFLIDPRSEPKRKSSNHQFIDSFIAERVENGWNGQKIG